MARFTILLAGRMDATPALRAAVAGTRIIAADRGIRHAATLGLTPELWVGDFDSASRKEMAAFASVARERFSPDKDSTDGELAIGSAIRNGASSVLLVGALGGPRSDHAFSNLVLMLRFCAADVAIEAFDGRERAVPLGRGLHRFDVMAGTQFSILKFSDLAGLTITGAKWPLADAAVPLHAILTQSNEAEGPVEITLASGSAIALFQAGPGSE